MQWKKTVILFVFFLASSLSAGSEASLFNRYIRTLRYRQPVSFIATLKGSAIRKRLARIPADAVKKGRKPLVQVYHRRYAGQVILVENVDPVFRKMFSLYNSYINMTGVYFTSKGENWKAFSKTHEMKMRSSYGAAWTLQVRARHHAPGNYGIFKISKGTMMVAEASFFSRNEKIYTMRISYRYFGRFLLPSRIVIRRIKNKRSLNSADILFSGYRINTSIPAGIF